MKDSRLFNIFFLMLAGLIFPMTAQAAYPDHPIRFIVPYTAGGPADILTRLIADKLTAALGQPAIVEYKPGAALSVGAGYVANSKPDGYTLFIGAASMLIASNPDRPPEKNLHDFVPVTEIGNLPLVLVINKDLPVHSVKELIDYARSRPGELNYGTSGVGSLVHMGGALFAQMAGLDMVAVHYKGINEVISDVIAGRIQLTFAGAPSGLPMAQSGQIRALAVTGPERTASAPDLPTMAEAALPGYDVSPWYGVLAPAGTPPEVVKILHDEIVKILQTDEIKKRWLDLGADAVFSPTPQDFGRLMQNDFVKWNKLVKDAKIQLQ